MKKGEGMLTETDDERCLLVSTFYLNDILMGIDTANVQEVVKIIDITEIPHAPEHILGVINLRGSIVTIMELGRKLRRLGSGITDNGRFIIVQWKDEYVGFLVDRISDVITCSRDEMLPPPSNLPHEQGRFIEGVYKADCGLITMLNIDMVMSIDEQEIAGN